MQKPFLLRQFLESFLPSRYLHQDSQSSRCQKKDWKAHQYDCSLLPVDLSPAIIEYDAEHMTEISRVAGLLEQWMEAYKPFQDVAGWRADTLPESKLIASTRLMLALK